MANKHITRCSTSLVIREMKMMRQHFYSLEWPKLKSLVIGNVGEGMENRHFNHCWWAYKQLQSIIKWNKYPLWLNNSTSGNLSQNLEIYCACVYKSQAVLVITPLSKLKTTLISISRRMVKTLWYIHLYVIWKTMQQLHIVKWEKQVTK